MKKINYRYDNLIKVMAACQRSINLYQHPKKEVSLAEREAYTASVIKHFELFFEMFWKFLKVYLSDVRGTDVSGSKTIFKASYDHKIITEPELGILLTIVDEYNTITHVYDEDMAQRVCDKIVGYYRILMNIVQRMKSLPEN